GELFTDMTAQLFSGAPTNLPPTMSGFVANYLAQPKSSTPADPRAPMHYFTTEQVPVLSTLAQSFGLSDCWHASAPCQTWPNRFFAHTGTSLGWINNSQFSVPFPAPSIFRQLHDNGRSWRVYFHDLPQSLLLGDIWWLAPLYFRLFGQFLVDAHMGTLPHYSFIEPRYFPITFLRKIPNDQHPPHNVLEGQTLVALIYNALRASPCWNKTLLIITYDEHGGCFDHVPPPAAPPPDPHSQAGFAFDRFGVRVPAVLVSPYVPAGSIIRPSTVPGQSSVFDHTSILSTLRVLFGLPSALTNRDQMAPNLLSALTLDLPSNSGPELLRSDAPEISSKLVVEHAKRPPNHMQEHLARMAVSLPTQAPQSNVPVLARPSALLNTPTAAVAHARGSAAVRSFLNL